MKKFLAMIMAVMMVLSIVTVPVMAESPAANNPRLSTAPKTGIAAEPADAANLDEALNIASSTSAVSTTATITFTVGDIWGDGSGYQMLLDADATAYGNEIPEQGQFTIGGDAPAGSYDAFEYKIPANADGSCSTTNVVVNNTVTIEIPAGIYDWCIVNPTPGDRIWIASAQGNVGGRADDYEFLAGYTYKFTVYNLGSHDATDVEIINDSGEIINPATDTPEPVAGSISWGFETDPFADGWTIRDDDGDGYNWEWVEEAEGKVIAYEGVACMTSASFIKYPDGGEPVTPDNWLISPEFVGGGSATFWYAGQDPSYATETFGVYVLINGVAGDELAYYAASGTYQQGAVDLSAYAGQTIQIAFRHYDVTDMFRLNIDFVAVGDVELPVTDTPVPVTDTPVPVTDTPGPITDPPEPITGSMGWGFETDPFADGWIIRDNDGDGYNWEWLEGSSNYNVYEGDGCMSSASYQNGAYGGTPLTPDNWLISPAFVAEDKVAFWYAGQDSNYAAETFGVYVLINGVAGEELAYYTASDTYQQGSVDLSAYAGQTIRVAFRHYNVTDMFRLNIDFVAVGDVELPVTDTPEPATDTPEPATDTPEPATNATITLTVGDVFGDGTGYQMLIDADATAYGNEIPATAPLTQSGDAPAGLYDAFEYKIPENADGSCSTSNVVVNNTVTIEIPAGIYDWCIVNPTPGDRIWIASAQGNVGGRADDYEFLAGYTYNFTIYILGPNDAIDVEIINDSGEIINPATDTPEPVTDTPEPVTPVPDEAVFSVGGTHYAAAGSQVSVDFTIEGSYNADGINVRVEYDDQSLTLNSVENGTVMQSIDALGGLSFISYSNAGRVSLGAVLPNGSVSDNGVVFTMNFTVAEGLAHGTEIPLEIVVEEFFSMPIGGERNDIAYIVENGAIVVQETHTVTFVDWDGTVLDTQEVESGADAVAPAAPTREGYTFIGWDVDFTNVTEDITVTAQYEINVYTVTFKDWDGTVLDVQEVEFGADAVAPAAPIREGYTFIGWDVDFANVTEDITVTAQYEINVYTVTFVDWDGTVIDAQEVEFGADAVAPAAPIREGYTFTGWDKAFNNVTANLVVTAQYSINSYTVTFKDWNGTVLKTEQVQYGGAATAPANPTREGYTFTGWDKAFSNITADLVVTAQYSISSYTVTFKDWNGTVLKTQQVQYGGAATAPANPTREGYTFTGWDKAFSNITADLVVTAQYEINVYTVTFVDWEGTVIDVQEVEFGADAVAPEAPVREGYTFIGWDVDFTNVTEDITVTAQYGILGDVNGDGVVNTTDALLILRMALGLIPDENVVLADFDGDGVITTMDALAVIRFATGIGC